LRCRLCRIRDLDRKERKSPELHGSQQEQDEYRQGERQLDESLAPFIVPPDLAEPGKPGFCVSHAHPSHSTSLTVWNGPFWYTWL
jgi:hypothetical protein